MQESQERSSLTYAALLPEIPNHLHKGTVTLEDADYLMLGISDKWRVTSDKLEKKPLIVLLVICDL